MKWTKAVFPAVILAFTALMASCQEAEDTAKRVAEDTGDVIQAEMTKNNEFLQAVKSGSLEQYPNVVLEEAFSGFFSSPNWKYFLAETGEHVVEFTGRCTYAEKEVKAKLQFVVEDESKRFDLQALEFNEVPQNNLIKGALIQAVFEGTGNEEQAAGDAPNEETEQLSYNDSDYLDQAMSGYVNDLSIDTIGNIFNNDTYFSSRSWEVTGEKEMVLNCLFNGEIVPGEGSKLQFTFEEQEPGTFAITSLTYNGEEVSDEGYSSILDLIRQAVLQ